MAHKVECSFVVSPVLILFILNCDIAVARQVPFLVNIGVVQDAKSPMGSMTNLCIEMAVSDFYSAHPNYTTRLELHKKDAETEFDAHHAALDLLEHEQVHGILGPQGSREQVFVSEVGRKVHVPIISFTARSSAFSNTKNSFFVRTTVDDSVQAQALAAICHGFGWTKVALLYEETEYGHTFLSHLNHALRDIQLEPAHLTAFPSSGSNSYIFEQLNILNKKETKVFLVHMNPSLGFRLFNLAKKVGMMSEGHAWIVSDSLSNFLSSKDSTTSDSMEGVVGIRPYVPYSESLENFQHRWKRNSLDQSASTDLNVYGLWAYDAVTALAIAVEKIGPLNSTLLYANNGANSTNMRISSYGPRLVRELSSTKFRGLSGDFELVDGTLKASIFEIINIVGTGERRVGFWSHERGIMREFDSSSQTTYPASTKELKNVVWPGDSLVRPKGWAIPPTGSLRVGVPCHPGYSEFVRVIVDPATNFTDADGFAIDIFLSALRLLPFPISFEFFLMNVTQTPSPTYDDMLLGIHQKYDMVVADTTIWAPRALHVDFSLPYMESRVVLVVKNKRSFDMWIFTKPLRWDLWLAIATACVLMGIVIWRFESQRPDPVASQEQATRQHERLEITYLAPLAALAFQDRTIVSSNWSVFVLVCWLFMAFILMQSFTANLSAILTLDQLDFAFSEDYYVGYHEGSFMKKFLIENLSIKESWLRGYSSVEDFHDAMSKGSKNGGIDVIFDEIPYIKLLMIRYKSQYKIVGPSYRTDGFGFAFPIGSSLVPYFSRAILNVTQGPEMISIEQKNFGPGYSSHDPLSSTVSQGPSSLTSHQFGGLFIIVASLTVFALVCSERHLLRGWINVAATFIQNRLNSKVVQVDNVVVGADPPVGLYPGEAEQGDNRGAEENIRSDNAQF